MPGALRLQPQKSVPEETRRWRKTNSNPQSPLEERTHLVEMFDLYSTSLSRGTEGSNPSSAAARLMVRPVCPKLRKCRVRPRSYAWCHKRSLVSNDLSLETSCTDL